MGDLIKVNQLYSGVNGAITQSGSITSGLIDLRKIRVVGHFSLHMINTGGTVTVTVLVCSTKNGTYIVPDTPITIISAGAAGSHFASFNPPLTPFIKLLFTETGVDAVTDMKAWLNYQ